VYTIGYIYPPQTFIYIQSPLVENV
jgi:hypothetical protein